VKLFLCLTQLRHKPVKVNVKLCLFLTKYHFMKIYWGVDV